MPEAINCKAEELTQEEWRGLQNVINEALQKFQEFRKTGRSNFAEGLAKNIQNIGEFLQQVVPFEEKELRP